MKEIVFVNVNYEGNAGDFWSSPIKYYDFSEFNTRHVHFIDVHEFLQNHQGKEHANIKDKIVIIGGGGLLTTKGNFIQETTEYLVKNNKVIFWGVGSNTFEIPDYEIVNHPNVLLAGIRDIVYGLDCDYVPCVSCKHSVFDETYEYQQTFGIIEHPRLPINIKEVVKITNQSNIYDIVKFIGSRELIVSSSFHGVYWSQLLDKKVAYYMANGKPNSKIINMKHRVPVCVNEDFLEKIYDPSYAKGLLKESRKLNDIFYHKVLKVLDDQELFQKE